MTIARPAGGEDALVVEFVGPITAGASLVVEEGETSVFARDGQPIRVIGPGRYAVPPEFAGAGVRTYFVRTTPVKARFGGPVPASRSGVRSVFGEAELHVTDACAVVSQLVPSAAGDAIAWLGARLQSAAAEGAATHGANTDALKQDLLGRARELERYGIRVADVGSLRAR